MVVGADDKAAYREVTLGANVDGLRIVTSGLKPDERVVVNGLQRVRPGALDRAADGGDEDCATDARHAARRRREPVGRT